MAKYGLLIILVWISTVSILAAIIPNENTAENKICEQDTELEQGRNARRIEKRASWFRKKSETPPEQSWEEIDLPFEKTRTLGLFVLGKQITFFRENSEETHTIAFDWRSITQPLTAVRNCENDLSLAMLILRNKEVQKTYQPGLTLFRVKLHSFTRLTSELESTARLLEYIIRGQPRRGQQLSRGTYSSDSILAHEDMRWIIYHVEALEKAVKELMDTLDLLVPNYREKD